MKTMTKSAEIPLNVDPATLGYVPCHACGQTGNDKNPDAAKIADCERCDGKGWRKPNKCFIAIGPFAWGRSVDSPEIAVKNAKKEVPRSYLKTGVKYPIKVFAVDDFLGVSGLGGINYYGAEPREIPEKAGLVVRTKASGY